MSDKLRPSQYADAKAVISESFVPGVALIMEGTTVPADTGVGYSPGAVFFKRAGIAGAQFYVNEGTVLSCAFKPLPSQTAAALAAAAAAALAANLVVVGVAAGYKVARGQTSTASASDTVVTGLATVVSVTASLDDNPVVGCSFASASIGDQAGTPAAGSILVKTWKPTTAGAAGNPDVIAATTFTKKVNWIAVGT